jgi:hypothetical protein
MVKATPVISWADPANITYGTPLSSTQLNATASVEGTFSYSPGAGTVLNAAAGASDTSTLSVTFTPTDTTNYNNASKSVSIYVSKADQTISFGALPNKTIGDPAFGISASASSGLGVGFASLTTGVCTVSGSTVTLVSTGTCTIRASQGGNSNYSAATPVDRSFTVSQPSQSLTVAVSPSGSGSISCNGGACASSYPYGTVVNLSATPAANYVFSNWSGSCSGSSCSLTMNGARSVTANFASSFNYSIAQQTSLPTLVQGNDTVVYLTTTLLSGATQGVTLSLSGLPSGVTYTLRPSATQNPSATYEVAFFATESATVGTFPITVTGTPLNKTLSFNLTVAAPTLTGSLTAKNTAGAVISSATTGDTVIYTAGYSGTATGLITYSGQSCGAGGNMFNVSGGSFSCTYLSTGSKTASVTLTQQGIISTPTRTITINAPPSTLIIKSTLDGFEQPGLTVDFVGSTFSGTSVPTEATQQSAYISETIEAPASFDGNSFLSWAGCDSQQTRRRECNVVVTNGGTRTVTVNYGSADFRPNLSVGSLVVDGTKYKENTSLYVEPWLGGSMSEQVYMTALISNSGKYDADPFSVSFERSADNSNFSPLTITDGTTDSFPLPKSASQKVWAALSLPVGAHFLRVCADPYNAILETNDSDNCTPSVRIIVSTPPPPPPSSCFITFDNIVTADANDDASTKLNVTATGCERWVEMTAQENASTNNSANEVLDYDWGGWRPFNMLPGGVWGDTGVTQASFQGATNLANNSGRSDTGGSGIGFGPYTWGGGPWTSGWVDLVGKYNRTKIGYGRDGTPRGIYNYLIQSIVSGRFKCFSTIPKTYDGQSNQWVTGSEYTELYPPPEPQGTKVRAPLTLTPTLSLCYERDNTTGAYYVTTCGSYTPQALPVYCPNGTVSGPTVTITGSLPTPIGVVRLHTLNVKSNIDNQPRPGVRVTQVPNSLSPADVKPFETSDITNQRDFSGTTDYTRTTDRNYTVTLEAPAQHSSATGSFTSWTVGGSGCNSVSDSTPETPENDGRRCNITMAYQTTGGQTRTVTAKYTGVLTAPVLSSNTPACSVGEGKMQLWWNAVPNATQYRLYRSARVAAAPNMLLPVAYAQSGLTELDANKNSADGVQPFTSPPSETSPYVDEGLPAGAQYDYYVKAEGTGGVASPLSAAKRDDASVKCPDLVVPVIDGITVTPGSTSNRGSLAAPIRAGEAKSFSATVLNQGGSKTSLYSPSFSNTFIVWDGNLTSVERNLNTVSVSNLDPNQATNPALQPSSWTPEVRNVGKSYTIEVCADQPEPQNNIPEGTIGELNNCSYLDFRVGLPDLTASPPAPTGTKIGNDFVANTPILLNGKVHNKSPNATAGTQNGTFYNAYKMTMTNPTTGTPTWATLGTLQLKSLAALAQGEENREIQQLEWGGTAESRITAGTYYLQVCADSGNTIFEGQHEGNNCSYDQLGVAGLTIITVSNKPTLSVQSTLNGNLIPGAEIGHKSGTPAPDALKGTTSYSITTDTPIDAVLRADRFPIASGSLLSHGFLNWSGCSSVSGRDCTVVANPGATPSITSNWESAPNIIFDMRKAGASTDPYITSPLSIGYGQGVELRFKGERCSRYNATTFIAGASSNPVTTWGVLPPSSSQKNASNSAFMSETVSNLTLQAYTFTIACSNSAGSVSKSLTVNVTLTGGTPISCAPNPNTIFVDESSSWSVTGAPANSTYSWTGTEFSPTPKTGTPVSQTYASIGSKTAQVTVAAPGGQVGSFNCTPLTVKGLPDLTASKPRISGATVEGTTDFIAATPLKLNADIINSSESWSVDTPNGDFDNAYKITMTNPESGNAVWATFSPLIKMTSRTPLLKEETRPIVEATWGGDGSIAAGDYWLRVCADEGNSIREKVDRENNNCSDQTASVTKIRVSNKPTLTVQNKLNGNVITTQNANARITQTSGTPVPNTLGDVTWYQKTPNSIINATLVADQTYGSEGYRLVSVQGSSPSTSWSGCTSASDATCNIVAGVGEKKTVTVEYQSKPDLTFEFRKAGTGDAFTAAPLSLSYASNGAPPSVEMRFKGERCGTYYATSAVGGASSNPPTSWSNNVATPSSAQKNITNTVFTNETVGTLTAPSYTFTLTCQNSAGTVTKTLTLLVGFGPEDPPLSCDASPTQPKIDQTVTWTARNVPTGWGVSWVGDDFSPATKSGNPVSQAYATVGTKKATATITATGGQTAKVNCEVPVSGYPNLTATAPEITEGTTIGGTSLYVANTSIKLKGSVHNLPPKATAQTQNGDFHNTYEVTMDDPSKTAAEKVAWSVLQVDVLPLDNSPMQIGQSRTLQSATWGGNNITNAGTYFLRTCADKKYDTGVGSITERDETDNCSTNYLTVSFSNKPTLNVQSKVNGTPVTGNTNAPISSTPAGFGGTTNYAKVSDRVIDATLSAPQRYGGASGTDYALVSLPNSTSPWAGDCTAKTSTDCTVNVPAGTTKTVTVEYQSKPDLTFEMRKQGVGSYQTAPLTVTYGDKVDVRFQGSRCGTYYAPTASGTAASSPTSTWSSNPTKTISNSTLTTEVVGSTASLGLTANTYVLSLTCENSAGPVTKTLTINVEITDIPMSCAPTPNPLFIDNQATWQITGAPSGSTYSWSGSDGLSGSTGTTNSIPKIYTITGTKTATVTVSAPGGQTRPIECSPLTVTGLPDLTASAPTVSGAQISGTTDFISATPLRVKGKIHNNVSSATAATQNGDFSNIYQLTLRDPALHAKGNTDADDDWAPLSLSVKLAVNTPLGRGESGRDLQELVWGGDNSITAGTYWLRTCADKPTGTIAEKIETNNCSPDWIKVTVSNRPSITVQSRVNGNLIGGAPVSQIGGTPGGLGDTTPYTRTPDSTVDATLRAGGTFTAPAPYGLSALVNAPGTVQPWEGCTQPVGTTDCRVAAGAGQTKVLTVEYQSKPDLTFEVRKQGVGSYQTGPLTLSYGENAEIRFKGERCGAYYTALGVGSAGSTPTSGWSDNVAATQKNVPNGAFTTATIPNLTARTYTLTLSCSNSAGVTTKTLSITVSLDELPLSCVPTPDSIVIDNSSTWRVTGAPSGSTYSWSGSDGLSGSTGTTNSIPKIYTITGTKTATVTVSAPGGQTRSVPCKDLLVSGRPDLTANPPTASGEQIAGATDFIAATPIRLKGAVNNNVTTATAQTPNGTFSNTYEITITNPTVAGANPAWSVLETDVLLSPDNSTLAVGAVGRALQEATWGGDNSITAGTYWTRTCADKFWETGLGTITERDENNNCSTTYTKVTVVTKPTLIVKTTLDDVAVGAIAVAGSQAGSSGTTALSATPGGSYTVVKAEKIDTTLTAPLDAPNAKFASWSCSDGTKNDANRTCTISVSGNSVKTVTAQYTSVANQNDLQFKHRKAGSGAAFSESAVTLVLGESDELQWSSPSGRCANPASVSGDWSGTRALSTTVRTENATPSTVRDHTYTITCSVTINGVTTTYPKTLMVQVIAPDLTANVPTAEGTKVGDNFVAGTTITLSGSVKNEALATAPSPGVFENAYELTLTDPSRAGANPTWVHLGTSTPVSSGEITPGMTRAIQSLIWGAQETIASGTYYVHICADKGAAIRESSETNNCGAATKITVVAYPDLFVSTNPAPVQTGTLRHGSTYTFSGGIRNQGSLAANPAFKNRFQIKKSTESGGGTDTLPNVSASSLATLAAGDSASVTSGSWTALAGRHALILCADLPDNAVFEWDEENNCSPDSVTVSAYPVIPTITAIELSGGANCGGKISLTTSGGDGGTRFELYRRKEGVADFGSPIKTVLQISDLDGVDDGLDPGSVYYYKVKAIGPNDLSAESSVVSARSTSACAGAKPDLVAVSVAVNGTQAVGSQLTFTGTVKNNGNVDVNGSTTFENRFTLTRGGVSVGSFSLRPITGLLRGDANQKTVTTAEPWTAEAGTYRMTFCADKGAGGAGVIDELDDPNGTNNCTETDFAIGTSGPPPSSVLSVDLSASPNGQVAPLQNVSLTANVTGTATGAVTYKFDYQSDGADDVVKVVSTPVTGDTSYSTTGNERYTYTAAGTYTARVTVTRGGESASATAPINVLPALTLTTGPGCQSVTSSWGSVNSVSSYTLYRSPTGQQGSYVSIGTFNSSAVSYVDRSVSADTTYFYKLQATLTSGGSLSSSELSQLSSSRCNQSRRLVVSNVYGSGRVRTDALNINCGSAPGQNLCEDTYQRGTNVRLIAEPVSGSTFTRWGGDCVSSGASLTCDVTLNANVDVTATFDGAAQAPTVPSCFPSPNPAIVGSAVTWIMDRSGGSGTYTNYTWTSASDAPLGDSPYTSGQSLTINEGYSTAGTKTAVAVVTDSAGQSSSPRTCSPLTVNPVPGFNYALTAESPVGIALNTTKNLTATKTLLQSPTQSVTLQVARIEDPSGGRRRGSANSLSIGNGNQRFTVTITDNNPSNPTSTSTVSVQTQSATPRGTYTVMLRGVSNGIADKTTTLYVDVSTTGQSSSTAQPVFEEF